MWDGLLSSDCGHGGLDLEPFQAETAYDAFSYAQDSIEAWVAQDLSSFEGSLATLEPGSASPTPGTPMIDTSIAEQLCYGMV